jgi:hypothetical protein
MNNTTQINLKLTPNLSFTARELRIIVGSLAITGFLIAAPTPVGWWGVVALAAVPVIMSGIIAWDPVYSILGINKYNAIEGNVQQRSWTSSNIGTIDRISRFTVGALLIALTLNSTGFAGQSVTALFSIPLIMSAIMAWDPFYAIANTNTFASKADVQATEPEMEEATLAKCYIFPESFNSEDNPSLGKAA